MATTSTTGNFAAIEARWQNEQPASEVIFAIPDEAAEKNRLELKIPYLGSLIASGREPLPHSGNMFFRSSVARKSANTRIRALSRLWAWRRTQRSAQCSAGTSNARTSVLSRSHK